MSLEHILLGMLAKPASGYDLKTAFDEGARYFWSAELSQIYPTLQRLEKRGWLKSHTEPSAKGPARRVYRRTPQGTRALHEWLSGEPQLGAERFAYIAQLIFMGELHDARRTLDFLRRLRAKLAAFLEFLRGVLADVDKDFPDGPGRMEDEAFHDWLCLRMGVQSVAAKVNWCDEAVGFVRERLAREGGDV
jgi:DNA-binding PadR family transcriptional regulator